jgi:hypothetical protein
MDSYENVEIPVRAPRARFELWDLFTILVLLTTACVGTYMLVLFVQPNLVYNPLPPGNPLAPATFTITPIQLEATWTPTVTPFQTATSTPRPTSTPIPSATPFSLVPPTKTPTVTKTPKAPFTLKINELQSDITVPHLQAAACNWQGVGGSVVDTNSGDIVGLVVRISGFYGGKTVNMTTVSGVSPDYGKSGFEFVLGATPIASRGQLSVQLLDQAGVPLSESVPLQTFADCKKNLSLVRFQKAR